MAALPILKYPNPILKRLCTPVPKMDEDLQGFICDMFDTLGPARGVGLAAPQVGRSIRLFVVRLDAELTFVNPDITHREGTQKDSEGCLSLPGVYEKIERAQKIRVSALDFEGKPFELNAEGFLAVAIQHEFDHLQGILMLDHLGPVARRMAVKSLR